MTVLLDLADSHEDRGIRPHSLKVTTIAALMGEIVKGKANLAQLAAQGNYRAVTAQDMGKVYSRNSPHRGISFSKLAKKPHGENQTAESLPPGLPGFSEKTHGAVNL